MNRSTNLCDTLGAGLIGATALLLACGGASAQSGDASVKARQEANRKVVQQPIRYARSVRPPVIDLVAMAQERRPGQVMPGDGYASGALPYGARHDEETLNLPNTAQHPAPRVAKRADVPMLVTPAPATAAPGPAVAPSTTESSTPEPMQAVHALVHEPDPGASAEAPSPAFRAPAAEMTPPAAPVAVASAPEIAPPAASTSAPEHPPVTSIPIASPVAVTQDPAPSPAAAPVGGGVGGGIEALVIENLPAPQSLAAARVTVAGVGGVMSEAQWRTTDGAWRQPRAGDALEGKIEVRAGINGEATLIIDERVQITVSRLGRIVIERAIEQGDSSVPTIALARGAIDVRPVPGAPVGSGLLARVRTPDQAFGIRAIGVGGGDMGVRVEYDAFSGTRRRASNP